MKKKIIAASVWLVILLLCMKNYVMLSVWAVITFFAGVNFYAFMKNKRQTWPFNPKSSIRNADMLIIGDMITPDSITEAGQKFVQIYSPGRSLQSCYEILRHTHSILDDQSGKSCVVIAVRRENKCSEGFSVFDVPFFHRITIKKYRLEKLRRLAKFPLIMEPLKTMKLLLCKMSSNYKEEKCISGDIKRFCDERNYRLKFFVS